MILGREVVTAYQLFGVGIAMRMSRDTLSKRLDRRMGQLESASPWWMTD